MNKFDLPAFFDRQYFESRYLLHKAKDNQALANFWLDTYFDNALSYAWVQVFEGHKSIDSKKAIVMADEHKKKMEKEYK